MNPDFSWSGALALVSVFVIGPGVGAVIAYAALTGKPEKLDPKRYGDAWVLAIVFFGAASSLFILAKWLNAEAREPHYLLQHACLILSGPLFGVATGCAVPVTVRSLRWLFETRLSSRQDKKD